MLSCYPPNKRVSTEEIRAVHRRAKFSFISTELAVAIKMCKIALSSPGLPEVDKGRRERYTVLAEEAYGAAEHFSRGLDLSPEMRRKLETQLRELGPLLQRLRSER